MKKSRTGYDKGIGEFEGFFSTEELATDPLLKFLKSSDYDLIRRNFTRSDLKSSLSKHLHRCHPDLHKDKSEEDQKKFTLFTGKLLEAYHNLVDLQLPFSLTLTDETIPYSIRHGYERLSKRDYLDDVKLLIEELRDFMSLETSHSLASANIVMYARDLSGAIDAFHRECFEEADIVTNPQEVERFLAVEAEGRVNENLDEFELGLEYGYRFNSYTPEEGWNIVGVVSVKHLDSRGIFDIQPNEWVVVDKAFIVRVVQVKGNSKSIVPYSSYKDYVKYLVGVAPSTVAMKTEDDWLFIAKAPYHKRVIQEGHLLIPIDNYVDAREGKIVSPDYLGFSEGEDNEDYEDNNITNQDLTRDEIEELENQLEIMQRKQNASITAENDEDNEEAF